MAGYKYRQGPTTPATLRQTIRNLTDRIERTEEQKAALEAQVAELRSAIEHLRRRQLEPKPVEHGTPNGYSRHFDRGENPCDACREAYNARKRELYRKRKNKTT